MNAEDGVVTEEALSMLLGFCHTAFVGDLRNGAQIERDRRKTRKLDEDK